MTHLNRPHPSPVCKYWAIACFFPYSSHSSSPLSPSCSLPLTRYPEDSRIVREPACRPLLNPARIATITSLLAAGAVDRGRRYVSCALVRATRALLRCVGRLTYLHVVLRTVVVDRDVLRRMARRSLWSRALVCSAGAVSKLVRGLCSTVFIGHIVTCSYCVGCVPKKVLSTLP